MGLGACSVGDRDDPGDIIPVQVGFIKVCAACVCVLTVNATSPGSDAILSQPTACYSRQAWQRPWALLDNHNCLHHLSLSLHCVSTWTGLVAYDHIPREVINLLSSDLLVRHYQRYDRGARWQESTVTDFEKALGKKHCNFPSPPPYLPAGPVFGWVRVDKTRLAIISPVSHVLSKCHGYLWTFPPLWRDEFKRSHRGKWHYM